MKRSINLYLNRGQEASFGYRKSNYGIEIACSNTSLSKPLISFLLCKKIKFLLYVSNKFARATKLEIER
jgi:hypothetical protein